MTFGLFITWNNLDVIIKQISFLDCKILNNF